MSPPRESLRPVEGAARPARRRLGLRGELTLARLPTQVVLLVLGLVEALSNRQLLFASLASSAFLIYLDPLHGTNTVRTLAPAQLLAAALGLLAFLALGPGYPAAGLTMVATIVAMIGLDAVHPPAVATALSFALRAGDESNLVRFGLAVAITAVLILLQRATLGLLARCTRRGQRAPSLPEPRRPQG